MAITYDQLVALLTPDPDGTLSVAGSAMDTDVVTTLFATYFPNGTLSLTGASSTKDADKQIVNVTGTLVSGTLLNLQSATLTASTFQLAGGDVTVKMTVAVGDAAWVLSKSFATFRGSFLDDMTYTAPVFAFDSTAAALPPSFRASFGYPADDAQVAAAIVPGLALSARIGFTADMIPAAQALITPPFDVSGPIEVVPQSPSAGAPVLLMPQMLLTPTASAETISLGTYSFPFTFTVASVFQEIAGATAQDQPAVLPTPVFGMSTEFTTTVTSPMTMALYLYSSARDLVQMNVFSTDGSVTVTPGDLPSMLSGTPLGTLLDIGNGFPSIGTLTLEKAGIAFSLSPLALESIELVVAMAPASAWQPFGSLFSVTGIEFGVGVTADGDTLSPSAFIDATATIDGNSSVVLDASVALPSLDFNITLTEAVPLDLTTIVKNLIGESIDLPSFTGGTFSLIGNVSRNTYQVDALIDEQWTIFGDASNGLTLGNLELILTSAPAGVSGSVYATLDLAGAQLFLFAGYAGGSQSGWTFSGGTSPGQSIDLSELFDELGSLFGFTIPPGLPSILLDQLQFTYDTSSSAVQFTATVTVTGAALNLTDLPLVGKYLDPSDTLSLGPIVFTFSKNGADTTGAISFNVLLGTLDSIAVTIPLTSSGNPSFDGGPVAAPAYPTQGSGIWIPVQRSFGPIQVASVGFTVSSAGVGASLNATLALSALSISVLGLEMTIPLSAPYTPSFAISGLGLSFANDAFSLSGILLENDAASFLQFDGEIAISVKQFSITALGSYATSDPPSFFVFALVNEPIGGPPYFFITGFSGGFGVNRTLTLPAIGDVATFPLVAGASPATNPFGQSPSLQTFITVMDSSMAVAPGQDWVAAGIRFTSFEIVDSYALLTVSFGTRVQVGLLGLSTLVVPPGDPEPVAFVQLALEAMLDPGAGTFFVAGQLTSSSYVFAKAAQLTGGFAFSIWFSPNDDAGDFVITVGGYNPYYNPPSNYPVVPQLGLNWQVSDNLAIKGGLYFALTPKAIMAGGSLAATWQSGPIRAWFNVYADFLIYWKPFHYDIRMGVSFGVSATVQLLVVTVTIDVTVGADLHIFGPPFSGVADIHLSVISFTISFGAGSSDAPPALTWDEFAAALLPPSATQQTLANDADATQTNSIVNTLISAGLLRSLTGDTVDAVVDPQLFVLATNSLIPSKTASVNGTALTPTWSTDYAVGPMQITENANFTSTHAVVVTRDGIPYDASRLSVVPNAGQAPKAMWQYDVSLDDTLDAATLLGNVLQGLTISPAPVLPDHSLPIDIRTLLFDVVGTRDVDLPSETIPTSDPWGGDDPWTVLTSTITGDPDVTAAREAILIELAYSGFGIAPIIDVTALGDINALQLLAPPVLHFLGENVHAS